MQNRAQEQYNGSRKVLTLYTPVARGSCKFTLRVANMSINFQHAAVQNVPILQRSHTVKYDFAAKTRLYLQMVRNFVLNLFAAIAQIYLCAQ